MENLASILREKAHKSVTAKGESNYHATGMPLT